MNKIFKVIYSKTRHCYVVVSELAKSHCKTTQSHTVRSKTALTAAVLLALGTFSVASVFMPIAAEAADKTRTDGSNFVGVERTDGLFEDSDYANHNGQGAHGDDSITIGLKASGGDGTITIGDRRAEKSLGSVYVGRGPGMPTGKVLPSETDDGYWATSVGYQSDATGYGSIAIGSNATANNSYDKDSTGHGIDLKTKSGDGKSFVLKGKPDIQRASVAIGYGASADNGNIAIGSYSDASTDLRTAKTNDGEEIKSYLTDTKADSYVSVGKTGALRRISNVADGASASDVATVGQLQALSAKVGVYDAGFGIVIDSDKDNKKNTISLNRNLGNDYNTTDGVNLKNDVAGTSLILGGRVEKGSPTGGQSVTGDYGALGRDSVTVGGVDNTVETSGNAAVVVGGIYNKAAGTTSAVVGGSANDAIGNESAVFGGQDNDAYENYATISGGSWNKAYGNASSIFGGSVNDVSGRSSVAVGGYGSHVYGDVSVGIAGGSTNADYALAAGNEATVTVQNGTAIGYQATANKEGTVAFGHDNGDVYYTSTWPQKATEKEGKYYDAQNNEITKNQYEALRNADLTFNDYSQKPIVTENKYDAAGYNRLVKVADGVDAHGVVVMEQLNQATNDLTKDLSVNAGWGINIVDEKDPKTGEVTKNVISLNRNLGKNYGNTYGGKGKVNFEADGENSLILGGEAINNSLDYRDKDFSYGAHAKDSVLVGGMNNDIDKNSERALIVGGTYNKTLSTGKVQQTGTDAIIVGGSSNKAEGDGSLLIGGDQNEASGLNSTIIGGLENKNESWDASILGGYYNQITGISQASGIFGGDNNKVVNSGFTYILGGENNIADGGLAVIVGGINNRSSGLGSSVFGGTNNIASGAGSSVIGGEYNAATNTGNVISGGFGNLTSGDHAYAAGGTQNYVTGMVASSLGGIYSSVNGMFSTGVAGGSTGQEAFLSLAAGYQSVVADGGAEKTYLTGADAIKVLEDMYSGKKLPGYYMRDFSVETGPDNPGRLIHYDKFSTALGYQATANKPGTIAFGHDAGDESGYTYEWETLTDEKGNPKQNMVDGTTNDYTKAPKSMKKNAPYTSAYYNRLVKVADGIDDHDVVVMEQLKQYAEKDANNIGNNLTVTPVYQTDDQGNIKLGSDNKPLIDKEKTEQKRKDDQTTNKNDWGRALGAGTFTAATNASTSDQLVTGKTLYNYDAPVAETGKKLNYVSANNTTGQNLSALDAQVADNASKLNGKTHNIKYYSVSDNAPTLGFDSYSNAGNDGAKGRGSLAAGFVTHADGIASTVAGSYSGVINSGNAQGRDLRGAAALSYGTFNVNQNTDTAKEHSGVANSIVGQANMTTNSNAAIIYGAGNTVTDSYRPIVSKKDADILGSISDPAKLSKAMQDAVKDSGGQVMVMGGGNNVESAYMSQVVGVGNTVKGNQVYEKNAKTGKWEWTTDTNKDTAIKDYDKDKSSQYNYVDGFSNEVINGKHDYVIGANNKLSGDSYDDDKVLPIKRSNKSNIVIGDNHTLTREKNTVIIGSSDTENTQTKANDAVIIGHNANATSDTGADNAVAIGRSAKATGGNAVTIGVNTSAGDNSITIGSESHAISGSNIAIGRSAQVYGYEVTNAVALGQMANALVADGVAIGSGSIATVKGNSVEGYDPTTGQDSTDGTATWKATKAAVSIGKADGTVTRQINGVAAGTNDTDAVNVAQIKKLASVDASNIGKNFKDGDVTTNENAWGEALGTGTVTKDNKQLVTGGTVYNEVRPSKDGAYVKMSQTTGANLIALDDQVKQNAQNISNNTYTQGDGILMDKTKKTISVNKGDGLKFTEDHKLAVNTGKHLSVNTDGQIEVGDNGTVAENDGNLVTGDTVYKALNGGMTKIIIGTPGKNGKDGTPGTIGLVGPAGTNGKDGVVDITIQKGEDSKDGTKGANGVDGKDGINRIVYEDKNGKHQVATMEDGLKFAGDDGQNDATKAIAKKLNNTVDIIGGADSTKLTANNIGVNNVDGKLKIQLAQELTGITSISGSTGSNGAKITLDTNDQNISVNGGKITDVTSGLSTNDGSYNAEDAHNAANISDVNSMISKAVTDAQGETQQDLDKKANVDASNIGTNLKGADGKTAATEDEQKANLDKWGEAIGTGEVKDGSKQLVTGGTVYNEVRPSKDGEYVKMSQTTGDNLLKLDDQVKQNAQNIFDNTYTQGDGILMDKTKKTISVNQGDGLKFDEGKLAVDAGNGLKIDNGAVAIKTSDSNLKVDSNGIGLSDKITIGSDKTKQVTIDGTKGEISGLTNTTWDSKADYSKSTKAATESQVDAAVKDAVKQAGDNDVDTHVKAGSYGVDANHQVSMDIVDKNGKATGKKVTITDVATHTEVGDVTKLDKGVQNASGTTSVVDAINNLNTSMNTKIGDQNYSKSNTSGTNKYVSDGDSITSAIGKLDGAVQQAASAAGKHSTVSEGSNIKVNGNVQNDGHTDYKVSLKDDISLNSVTTKSATTDTLTVNNSATIGGVTIENKTISGLDDTKIEKDSKKAVNAGTIYNELRPATDGTYIKSTNTTAQNLTSLDTQVRATHDLINSDGKTIKIGGSDAATKIDVNGKDGKGRVITGVVSDANDPNSAANVGYVNGLTAANTQQIYRDMNNAYSRLDTNINRAAAGSNALAALHLLDFDPADKASFAVGYGHYHNANAAAVGAFYQPNANTMVNMGISLGNGDPGFNAGVSFKIGKGSAYNGVSKAEMAQTIHDQATEISAIKADDAAKDKRIDALEKENQEMKKQIQEILARLNG